LPATVVVAEPAIAVPDPAGVCVTPLGVNALLGELAHAATRAAVAAKVTPLIFPKP
jgi:hypothetical protein